MKLRDFMIERFLKENYADELLEFTKEKTKEVEDLKKNTTLTFLEMINYMNNDELYEETLKFKASMKILEEIEFKLKNNPLDVEIYNSNPTLELLKIYK